MIRFGGFELIIFILAILACQIYNPFQSTHNRQHEKTKTGNNLITVSKPSIKNNIRILCLVLTHPTKEADVKSIQETWGPKCTKIFFFSIPFKIDAHLVSLNITHESRSNLWEKVRQMFIFAHDNFINDYDWFIKADDDTYVIMENLKYFLSQYNPNQSYYFGK
ncbi:hypothetical protein HZS_176 [Henneguya salminicola]|nr:hypothetical protein HZS_176 [Henneguya salminicola]